MTVDDDNHGDDDGDGHDDNDDAFLWLADTVWFGLTDRISNAEWKALMEKRTKQGFNVMQVVSGLLPEAAFGEPSTLLDGVASWTLDKKELENLIENEVSFN